ncbi:MAG: HDOD domain-containing protein [Syntrophobacteraceae bacterium]|nr:HDOD domain-containing protein [Desulfobacteraceae bacterium]
MFIRVIERGASTGMGKIIYPFGFSEGSEDSADERSAGADMSRQEIKRIVRRLDTLPALPGVASRILRMLTEEEPDVDELVRLVESDQAVTMKLLKMVHSAATGARITSVQRAILILGFSQIRCTLLSLTISESLVKTLRRTSTQEQVALWKHCLACAVCAEMIAERVCPNYRTEAFVGGMVHDVGKLILEESLPEKYAQVRSLHSEEGIPWIEAEQQVLGVDHATAGKWLAEKWNLPEVMVQAIWLHHHPLSALLELDFVKYKEVILAVNLASSLAHNVMADSPDSYQPGAIDREIAEYLRLKPRDLKDLSIAVGKRYSDRASIMDFEEDEVSFYFQALQRANQELARLASRGVQIRDFEDVIGKLHHLLDFQLDLAQLENTDEILSRIAQVLVEKMGRNYGAVYFLDRGAGKLLGRYWTEGKRPRSFSLSLGQDGKPATENSPSLDAQLSYLIRTYHTRLFKVSADPHRVNMLQYQEPYLIVPLSIGGESFGEILVIDDRSKDEPGLSETDLKGYGYLAAISAVSLSRVHAAEKGQEMSETLNRALLKNGLILSQLKQTRQRFEYLFECSNDAIILHNTDGRILQVNQRAVELLVYGKEEFADLTLSRMLPESQAEAVSSRLEEQWHKENGARFETRLLRKDGREIDVEISSRIVDAGTGMVQSILRDITSQKDAAQALAAEKERLSVTLRSIGDGAVATDREGRIILANRVAEKLTGYSEGEATGKPFQEVLDIVDMRTGKHCDNLVERVLDTGGMVDIPEHAGFVSRDGVERNVSASCAPIRDREGTLIGAILVFRDITEKRRMEQELLKVQKLESIGVLAGGIAHDFNNILSAIIGNISLAKVYSKPGDKVLARLEDAEKASLRARDLTQQLLTFSKGGAPVKKTASIAEMIKDTVSFMLSGSNVRCEFTIPQDLWPVDVDTGQISQVINNLVVNARQAMPGGGTLRVRAENLSEADCRTHPVCIGQYVRISIEDQGTGIAKEDLHKIFDPYFTTKQSGHGLGLATSYSIVTNHGGYIFAESEPGVGTTFHIYLPASSGHLDTEDSAEGEMTSAGGSILVMDDEEIVRQVIGMMLEHLGYEVAYAVDGAEAIELYEKAREAGRPFDLVIMDLTVPGGMGGKEAMQRLLELDPGVKAIVSSGYSSELLSSESRKYGFSGVVSKPYKIEELSEAVSKALNRGAGR